MDNADPISFRKNRNRLVIVTTLVWAAIWLILARIFPQIYREHGPMENFQALGLATGVVLSASLLAPRFKTGARILGGGLALFYLGFLLLEFDTRHFDMPTLQRWTNGRLRNLWVGSLTLIYAIALARHFNATWATFINWVRSIAGFLMILSGGFWVLGHLVDKAMRFWGHGEEAGLLAEELVECEAVLLMILSAVITRFFWSRTQLRG